MASLDTITKCDVFTPDDITKQMTNMLLSSGCDKKIKEVQDTHEVLKTLLEPSVGTGNLLKYINFDEYDTIDVYDIKKNYLDQIPFTHKHIHKYNLDFLMTKTMGKFYSHIILNPPYLKIQDLPSDYRKYLQQTWNLKGNIDIYYIFLLKCLEQLHQDGCMVSITPNSFLYTKSAVQLREVIFGNRYVKEIIDFKSKKVFKNISTYCCITVFTKSAKDSFLYNEKVIQYEDVCRNKEYNIFSQNDDLGRFLMSILQPLSSLKTTKHKVIFFFINI